MTHLSHLSCIEQLTIANNPAVEQPENERQQFDYRPYVINWCLSLRVLDGIGVGAKERLVRNRDIVASTVFVAMGFNEY